MPHRCLECDSILESGDMDLKSGCPVCGGRKFEAVRAGKKGAAKKPAEKKPADPRKLTVSQYVAYADAIEPKPPDSAEGAGSPAKPPSAETPDDGEKRREAPRQRPTKHADTPLDAKHGGSPAGDAGAKEKTPEHRIDSIRIVEKGSYDLNLPMLLSRKELVMSRDDGVYVVDLPSALKSKKKK